MFAMYDDDGLNFRSTIDRLYTVHEAHPSKVVKNKTSEDEDDDQRKEHRERFQDQLYKGKINDEAKNKYKQIANLDTRVEVFHVEQLMNHTVITVDDTATIQECYDMMQEKNIQQLTIRASNPMYLKGMITKSDILNFFMDDISYVKDNVNKPISEIYKQNIITTDPISDIRRVSKVMVDFNLNAIPVIDSEDRILGIVTRTDILKAVASIPHLQIWA
ncbi:MAG: CBS domain-containing protein [Campylobacterota bacterium]|nr:CBS domain-containing protein [Campylobacterota bacterium]